MEGPDDVARVTRPRRARRFGPPGVVAAVASALVALTATTAVFTATTGNSTSTLSAATLNTWLPTAATAARVTPTSCTVSWTPSGSLPTGLTYDVSNGSSTVATAVSATSTTITVPAATVTPAVYARVGSWISLSSTAAASTCAGWPDAPGGLSLAASDGQVVANWTAPSGNGSPVTGYTATLTPGGTTCARTAGTTTCTFAGLTNGNSYSVAVTATSALGTGPAASASAIPYPSAVMTSARMALWLDGADTSTLFASSSCTGASATSAVGCWKDKSAQANNATQASAGSQPGLTTVNGHSAPSFDGSASTLALTASSLPNGAAASTQFVAATLADTVPTSSGYRTVLAWGNSASTGATRTLGKTGLSSAIYFDTRYSGLTSPGSWPVTSPAIVVAEAASGQTRSAINGLDFVAPTTYAFSTGTTEASVGANFATSSFWNGPIPELIVFSGTLTAAERRQVDEYLARKWGVAIAPGAPTSLVASVSAMTGTSATLTWTAPAYDGGSALTGYTATATPLEGGSAITCTAAAPATTCVLSGMSANASQYSVSVTATNAVGVGAASSSVSFFSGAPYGGGPEPVAGRGRHRRRRHRRGLR